MLKILLIASVSLWLANRVECFRTQSVWVKGRLMCGTKPANGVLVKLIDADNGPNPDDLLDSAYTDNDGYYNMKGDSSEITNIDPELRIYHDCNDYGKPCQREWIIRIPDKYIFDGIEPKRAMNLGIMNLEVELEDENQDCVH
uniref:Transthyretin-like protein 46 n=1 Tax=Ascaris suum TaxID=6253 RepID=F1LH47_ASCSU